MELLELLDDRRLEGLHRIRRTLGPERSALAVDAQDLGDCVEAIETVCQLWSGACFPLLPAVDAKPALSERWQRFLDECLVDRIWHRQFPEDGITYRGSERRLTEWELGEFLVAVLDAADARRDQWAPVVVSRLEQDSDWFIAYATALGLWPDAPDARRVERFGYVEGLSWDQVVGTEFESVDEPGPADLLDRLRRHKTTTPARMSCALLQLSLAARSPSLQSPAILPRPSETAQQVGPNVVVIYEPGSVEDLALLWNLRMANGLPDGLPMGLPRTADLEGALRHWQNEFAFKMWTLGHDRCAITSASIDLGEFTDLAENVSGLSPGAWSVVSPDELLRDSDRPARVSRDTATFEDGFATVTAWDAMDREELGRRRGMGNDFGAIVRFTLLERHIPPSRSFELDYSFLAGWRGGGYEIPDRRYDSLTGIRWPAGWTVIEALARDRGLRAKPSTPGLAAAALLRRIGSINDVYALLSPSLVELLYRLSERRGMTWFRRKLREIGAALDDEVRERLDEAIAGLHHSATDEEQQEATFSQLVSLLRRDGAEAWLRWAEDHELLIRGARIRCDRCEARSWRALEELSAHPVCRGCGHPITSPYKPGELSFAYRAGETVLQAMQHDALVHLFAMRWFCELFRPSHDRPAGLYGAYPGVEFFEGDSDDLVGEADVLLVQADGQLVVGECKRRGVGLNQDEVDKVDRLAERLDSPWSFLATLDRSADCPPIWKDSTRTLPQRPRFALTAEQLFDDMVSWALGDNPFGWREDDDVAQYEREAHYVDRLAETLERMAGATIEQEMMRPPEEQAPGE